MILKIPVEKYNAANALKKRDCYSKLEEYLNSDSTKICILYGLRGTGKSTLMFQAMKDTGPDNCGYILCGDGDSYGKLCRELDGYISRGKKAVFIDEITKLSDFIASSVSLADYYSGSETKIVITGADSLGLDLVTRGELHGRVETVHTTYISYGEFSRLTGKTDMDDFIHYSGVLYNEDKDCDRTFFNRKSASRYIDSAISGNIANTFFKDRLPQGFAHKYDRLVGLNNINMLIPVITAIVEMYGAMITEDDIEAYLNQEKHSDTDVSSVLRVLLEHNIFIGKENFHEDAEGQIIASINLRSDMDGIVGPEAVSQIIDYLYELELIVPVPVIHHDNSESAKRCGKEFRYGTSEYIYQAGIKYCQAEAFIDILKTGSDTDLPSAEREIICRKLTEDVKGRILEIAVFSDLIKFLDNERYDIFKMDFSGEKSGEIDTVVFDKHNREYYCFDVEYSNQTDGEQHIGLSYRPFRDVMDKKFGKRKISAVLYRGETAATDENGISYLNVEKFLSLLYLFKEPDIGKVINDC